MLSMPGATEGLINIFEVDSETLKINETLMQADIEQYGLFTYGETIYTCQICGYEYSENNGAYPTGHNYINLIEKEPTCTQYGQRKVKCETCGDEYTMIISANGHNYEIKLY